MEANNVMTAIDFIAPITYAAVTAAGSIGIRFATASAAQKNYLKKVNAAYEAKCKEAYKKKYDNYLKKLNENLAEGAEPIKELTKEQLEECKLTEDELQGCQLSEDEKKKIYKNEIVGANVAYVLLSTVLVVAGGFACYMFTADAEDVDGTTEDDTAEIEDPGFSCTNGWITVH